MRQLHGLDLTDHAAARMQQRGIRAQALETLLDYGRVAHVEGGRDIVYFDKKARAGLDRAVTRTYAILASDGTVVTVGHRFRRIPRN
jgi:hypothetical protein